MLEERHPECHDREREREREKARGCNYKVEYCLQKRSTSPFPRTQWRLAEAQALSPDPLALRWHPREVCFRPTHTPIHPIHSACLTKELSMHRLHVP